MTTGERRNHALINGSRRKRIAKGSGTSVEEVNRVLKQFVRDAQDAEGHGRHGRRRAEDASAADGNVEGMR